MNSESKFEAISLIGLTRQPLKSLAGFDKSRHTIPKNFDDRTREFVTKIACQEIEKDLETIFRKLRQQFKFKRREILAPKPEFGCGIIQTPYFCYSIQIQSDPDDPSNAYWERSVRQIEKSEKVFSGEFASVFDFVFDRVEFCFEEALDLEQWVDGIEAKDNPNIQLDYDSQLTHCLLQVSGLAADIKICRSKVTVVHPKVDYAENILNSFLQVRDAINTGISIGEV